jgi:hypothetical protein
MYGRRGVSGGSVRREVDDGGCARGGVDSDGESKCGIGEMRMRNDPNNIVGVSRPGGP